MKRPDRLRLVEWAMAQPIPPNETKVLIAMALECDSPYSQVPFSIKRCHRKHGMAQNTVRRGLRDLLARGLISERGRKPMDGHRYVNVYQLETALMISDSEKEGSTMEPTTKAEGSGMEPTRGFNSGTHLQAEGSTLDPTTCGKPVDNSGSGFNFGTPSKNYIYNHSDTELRGSEVEPSSGCNGGTHPALANLPPNANRALARLIEIYPPIEGEQSFAQADHEYRERKREGLTESQMVEGIKRYAAFLQAKGTPTQYTMHLKKFIGPDKHFMKPWTVQATGQATNRQASKAERLAAAYQEYFGGPPQ